MTDIKQQALFKRHYDQILQLMFEKLPEVDNQGKLKSVCYQHHQKFKCICNFVKFCSTLSKEDVENFIKANLVECTNRVNVLQDAITNQELFEQVKKANERIFAEKLLELY